MEIDPKLQIELVKALGNILTAAVPSTVTFILGRKFVNMNKIKSNYVLAMQDIKYLLGVEELHCREHTEQTGKSMRVTIREAVKIERNLKWSGKHTLSQIEKRAEKLK